MKTLFNQIRAAIRLLLFALLVLVYFCLSGTVSLLTPNRKVRRGRQIFMGATVCRFLLKAFNVTLIVKNEITQEEQSLLVGNHLGFIDIVCLQAIQPAVFITSLEMKNTPVLGQITDLGGCAYVDRRNRMKIHEELKDIVQVLKDGFRVVLYAESVASNGEQVLPFKKTLMMAASYSGRPIRPFVFNFRQVNGGAVEFRHRDSLCWYGDQDFFSAVWRSLQLDSITCEIEFLPQIYATPEDDRTSLAEKVHRLVAERFVPFKPQLRDSVDRTS
jgi:lyso-ornithine lipid O-acyltransferase